MSARNYKVLVADDDESVRESLRKLLQVEGYQVAAVADGVAALEAFFREQKQIDLLLVDLNMPLKNGWATVDRLRQFNPSLPVLIVTGQPNQHELAETAGVSALVEKPIDVPALLEVINKLLPGPGKSSVLDVGQDHSGFHFVRAAGYTSLYPWKEREVTPFTRGGLNE